MSVDVAALEQEIFERLSREPVASFETTILATQLADALGVPVRDVYLKFTDARKNQTGPRVELLGLTREQMLAPVEPERELFPGVPTEAYTVVAGALSSGKTTAVMTMLLSRASGFDLFGLCGIPTSCDLGPCVLLSYEDCDQRIAKKLRIIIQWAHAQVLQHHGADQAQEFLDNIEKHFRRVTLTGQADSALVHRASGSVVRNEAQLDRLCEHIGTFAKSELMMAIDPLRLAFRGSQNDDDGADVAVETLNYLAGYFPDSGLIVPTHTTKAGAVDGHSDRAAQAYATSGSALFSQHARSNFHMWRPAPDKAAAVCDTSGLKSEELERQQVTVLSHARLSHGPERTPRAFVMRGGVLVPLAPPMSASALLNYRDVMHTVALAIARIGAALPRVSKKTLEQAPELRKFGARDRARDLVRECEAQGWIEGVGKTSDKTYRVTAAGRAYAGFTEDRSMEAQSEDRSEPVPEVTKRSPS